MSEAYQQANRDSPPRRKSKEGASIALYVALGLETAGPTKLSGSDIVDSIDGTATNDVAPDGDIEIQP